MKLTKINNIIIKKSINNENISWIDISSKLFQEEGIFDITQFKYDKMKDNDIFVTSRFRYKNFYISNGILKIKILKSKNNSKSLHKKEKFFNREDIVRNEILKNSTISKDELVKNTGIPLHIMNNLYMKIRRELWYKWLK